MNLIKQVGMMAHPHPGTASETLKAYTLERGDKPSRCQSRYAKLERNLNSIYS
jgi:hypothetical protein